MFGEVWCGEIQICAADATFRDSIPHLTAKRPRELPAAEFPDAAVNQKRPLVVAADLMLGCDRNAE